MDAKEWFEQLASALNVGTPVISGVDEFDRACDHIAGLLQDSARLLLAGSSNSAAFLAITALEEVAKVYVSLYRRGAAAVPRSRDPLFSHARKQRIAASPTLPMGSRLSSAVGEMRVTELMAQAADGTLVSVRESCLYLERDAAGLVCPKQRIGARLAREILLFVLEATDDALIGYSNHSMVVGDALDELFSRAAGAGTANEDT